MKQVLLEKVTFKTWRTKEKIRGSLLMLWHSGVWKNTIIKLIQN